MDSGNQKMLDVLLVIDTKKKMSSNVDNKQ